MTEPKTNISCGMFVYAYYACDTGNLRKTLKSSYRGCYSKVVAIATKASADNGSKYFVL